jgi:DNA-binding response OmpR family regulator
MGRQVLVIEDEPNIAEAIKFILTRDGWRVATHPDGTSAMAAVQRLRPDVLVLDLMLPGLSGLEVLRLIRADPAFADLPVLMLTAKGQERDRQAAQQAGANLFMTKPFANADMVSAVRGLAGL